MIKMGIVNDGRRLNQIHANKKSIYTFTGAKVSFSRLKTSFGI
jgi:hypothetical protein